MEALTTRALSWPSPRRAPLPWAAERDRAGHAARDQPEHQEARGRALGVSLFARDLHDVSLTEAGTRARPIYARKMLRRRATMRCAHWMSELKHLIDRNAEHRVARIGGGLPAAGRAAALPAERFRTSRSAIYRSRLEDIPRQVMDREMHVGFVKESPPVQGADLRAGACRRNGAGGQPRPPACAAR